MKDIVGEGFTERRSLWERPAWLRSDGLLHILRAIVVICRRDVRLGDAIDGLQLDQEFLVESLCA